MGKAFHRPEALADVVTHYCPGCGHGIAHRLVAEVIDELGIRERTIGDRPGRLRGAALQLPRHRHVEAAHGRAPAVATGIKRVAARQLRLHLPGRRRPGGHRHGEIIHAANRGENITVIFINNAVYGMTGGQMAPTTMLGQKTTTTPVGRKALRPGVADADVRDALGGWSRGGSSPGEARLAQARARAKKPILKAFSTSEQDRLQPGGAGQHLPHELGHDAGGRPEMGGGEDDSVLPSG